MGGPKVKCNSGKALNRKEESKYMSMWVHRGSTPLANQTFILMAEIPLVRFIRGVIGCLIESCAILDTFVLEVTLEELQAHQSKDTQTEDGEDGHISQLLH